MNNKALKTLFVFNGIFVFASSLLGLLYAIFVSTIDQNVIFISLSWAVFLLFSTLFMFVIRKFGDKVKEKEYLLLGGFLVRAIVWFIFPSITTFSMLIVLQIFLGLGEALGTPAYSAIFAEHLDKGKQIQEYTDWSLVSNIVGAIAVVGGGVLVSTVGFPVLFYLMGTLAMVSFIGILIKPRDLL